MEDLHRLKDLIPHPGGATALSTSAPESQEPPEGMEWHKTDGHSAPCERCGGPTDGRWSRIGGRWVCLCETCRPIARAESLERAHQDRVFNPVKYLVGAGVPKMFHASRLADFGADFRDLLSGGYLWGPVGTGKTHLAAALLREILIETGEGRFISTPRMLGEIKALFAVARDNEDWVETEEGYIARHVMEPFLVLDDLGAEYVKAWGAGILFQVIDGRLMERMPMLITSNLHPDDLADRYGEWGPRLASRVRAFGPVVKIEGRDRRTR